MADDDEAARKARADSLRQRIASLKPNQVKPDEASDNDSETDSSGLNENGPDEAPLGESPREFVQRKMRELDNKT
jgi:hypothetical protein